MICPNKATSEFKANSHRMLCSTLHRIYLDKNADYGDSFGQTFERFGLLSAVVRMADKMARLESLTHNAPHVTDEAIIDTLMDLANYALMTVIEFSVYQHQTAQRD